MLTKHVTGIGDINLWMTGQGQCGRFYDHVGQTWMGTAALLELCAEGFRLFHRNVSREVKMWDRCLALSSGPGNGLSHLAQRPIGCAGHARGAACADFHDILFDDTPPRP